jgi:polyisoprenoid-binding protein YceI
MFTALAAALTLTTAAAAQQLTVDPAASTLRYHVVHKLHRVEGESKTVEGKAVVQEDGRVLAMVRVPIATFHSGDGNRDAHMQETVEAQKFPFVVVKGVAQLDPATAGAIRPVSARATTAKVQLEGEVELHGVRQPVSMPLTVDIAPDGTVRARGSFDVSLDRHGVERPALLFVKVDDACTIDFDLALRPARG